MKNCDFRFFIFFSQLNILFLLKLSQQNLVKKDSLTKTQVFEIFKFEKNN